MEGVMWLGTREIFRPGDPGWDDYVRFVGLPHLREVRTIDAHCNPRVADEEPVYSPDELRERLARLPRLESARAYHLLFTDALASGGPPSHPRLRLLGYDLSDDTWTSSLLNCGCWQGVLEPIAGRTADNGLLGLDDAILARSLLPDAWDGDPHAFVTVWALFEFLPEGVAVDA